LIIHGLAFADLTEKQIFTLNVLNGILQMTRNAVELLVETDSLVRRNLKFKRGLEGVLLPSNKVQKDFEWKMK
jgi:hypothetical protein